MSRRRLEPPEDKRAASKLPARSIAALRRWASFGTVSSVMVFKNGRRWREILRLPPFTADRRFNVRTAAASHLQTPRPQVDVLCRRCARERRGHGERHRHLQSCPHLQRHAGLHILTAP